MSFIKVGVASAVLEQLTIIFLVSFKKNWNTFHTLSESYYFHFKPTNVGWEKPR